MSDDCRRDLADLKLVYDSRARRVSDEYSINGFLKTPGRSEAEGSQSYCWPAGPSTGHPRFVSLRRSCHVVPCGVSRSEIKCPDFAQPYAATGAGTTRYKRIMEMRPSGGAR